MNILVTGGAGFIGSHLAERLLQEGHRVVAIDNFDAYYDPAQKWLNLTLCLHHSAFRLVEGDIRDEALLYSVLGQERIDTVVHLAAKAGVRPSLHYPEQYMDVNLTGTAILLKTMQSLGVRRLVFASSSSVYGNSSQSPFREDAMVDAPQSPYAASKRAGELLCRTYHQLYDFAVTCLRFFTVYGPRQRPEMAIHQFIEQITNQRMVTMYGNGYTARDYTYVADIVEGIGAALRRLNGFQILNLGNATPVLLSELITTIETSLGVSARIRTQPIPPGDVMATCADISLAGQRLGYQPRVSLIEGLQQQIQWQNQPTASLRPVNPSAL